MKSPYSDAWDRYREGENADKEETCIMGEEKRKKESGEAGGKRRKNRKIDGMEEREITKKRKRGKGEK